MEAMLNPQAKFTKGLSYHHTKEMNKYDRHRFSTYGYSFKQSIKFGIPVSNTEVREASYVKVNDLENRAFKLHEHGFECKIYENGNVRYNYIDVAPLLPKKVRVELHKELSVLRTEYRKKYKEYYRKLKLQNKSN